MVVCGIAVLTDLHLFEESFAICETVEDDGLLNSLSSNIFRGLRSAYIREIIWLRCINLPPSANVHRLTGRTTAFAMLGNLGPVEPVPPPL